MQKLKNRLPSYRLHKASDQAVVTLNARDIYLGRYNSAEIRERYQRELKEWPASHRQVAPKGAVETDPPANVDHRLTSEQRSKHHAVRIKQDVPGFHQTVHTRPRGQPVIQITNTPLLCCLSADWPRLRKRISLPPLRWQSYRSCTDGVVNVGAR